MTAPLKNPHPLTADHSFEPLAELVIAATGLSYYRNRCNELSDHIARRLNRIGLADCTGYLKLLQSGDDGRRELDELIEDLTIGETHFFRHPELLRALEETILPAAIEKNKDHRRLRIWSAGSSIGAEAYTVSILLKHHLAHLTRGWDVTIIGTDINRSFLARAARAEYEEWAMRGTSADIRRDCFTQREASWSLKPQFQQGVSFQYHNLAGHPFPSMLLNLFAFDVILCRNVMIYFSPPVIRDMIGHMRRCLVDGGWLLVGHAEHSLDLFREFRTVGFPGATAYQRMDGHDPATNDSAPHNRMSEVGGRNLALGPGPSALDPQPLPVPATNGRRPPAAIPPALPSSRKAALRKLPASSTRPDSEPPAELPEVRALADAGHIEAAVARCEQLLKTHKMNPACHLHHALMLEQLGRHSLCEHALRRAIYIDRGFVLAHYYLGVTLQRLHRGDEAAQSLRNVQHLLGAMDDSRVIGDSDGLTVAELSKLARMQLEAVHT